MVREAEEDKKVKEKINARNALETYVSNMKNQISDKDKMADKLEADEKDKIEAAIKEALEWLDDNQSMDKKEYDEKLKEVEAVCNPIITSVYQRTCILACLKYPTLIFVFRFTFVSVQIICSWCNF
ncbi:putative Heat shock protein 70 family [Helianthus annuus]|nr:putative Heat shock protein 70 family [Helianthus annuus]